MRSIFYGVNYEYFDYTKIHKDLTYTKYILTGFITAFLTAPFDLVATKLAT